MLYIDDRSDYNELARYFEPYDVPVSPVRQEFGDLSWFGEGPDGNNMCPIGVERKVVDSDLVSSIRDKRLQGRQLGGMLETYGQFAHLLIEGIWRPSDTGMIEVSKQRGVWEPVRGHMMMRELDHFISTWQYKHGLIVAFTANKKQTAAWAVSRYKWWNDKTWEEHKSDKAVYAPFDAVQGSSGRRASFTRRTVPKVEKHIAQLDGFDAIAYQIAKVVRNSDTLCRMRVDELAELQIEQNMKGGGKRTVRLGSAKAVKLYEQLREE